MPSIHIIFFDKDEEFSAEMLKQFKRHFENYTIAVFNGDVRQVPRDRTVFISPANSLGFMDGGIDDIYRKMFPEVERLVQAKIKTYDYQSALGRYFLPIGSAAIVDAGTQCKLVCAPTMWLPEPVKDTQNAYWAFRAILALVDKFNKKSREKIQTIACPGLATGCGRMSFSECASQILRAMVDHELQTYPDQKPSDPTVVWNEPNKEEQSELAQNEPFKMVNLGE
jgi:O-acetyl-ADP-ribose deacetylase (regulator of RNase III)